VEHFHPGRDLATRPFLRGGSPHENPPPPVRLIVTRALHEDYNHWHILEAMSVLHGEGLETFLDVVGDGPLRGEIEARAGRLPPGAVRFHGQAAHSDLPELLRAADLYVSMPITEGLSASLVEAMGCGVYPIVTDHPGNRHLIDDGENGDLVGVGDVPALARAISRAWSRPELRAAAQVRNRAFVEEHMRSERNLSRMVDRYRELVDRHREAGEG
jgi:glycosyltransferase involved in cell wall biosynthesis